MQLVVPANEFGQPEQVSLTSGSVTNLPQGIPTGVQPLYAFGVSFAAPPSQPLTLTIQNANIPANTTVYKVTASGWVSVPATITAGEIVISFTSDPDFVIVTSSTQPGQGQGSGSGTGSTGSGSGSASQTDMAAAAAKYHSLTGTPVRNSRV